MSSKPLIRDRLRQMRRTLSREQQDAAAIDLSQQFQISNLLTNARHIGIYLASDGEIDLAPTINWLWQNDKQCYLPIIHEDKQLKFALYSSTTELKPNCYGILEPIHNEEKALSELDAILLPLVAFDKQGHRLGRGGGYYDVTLNKLSGKQRSMFIGCAYHFQEQPTLPTDSWDIKLDAIVTDTRSYRTLHI